MTLAEISEKNCHMAGLIGQKKMLMDIANYLINTGRNEVANDILRTFDIEEKKEVKHERIHNTCFK